MYVLETKLGWDRICVEPAEGYYEQLVGTRDGSVSGAGVSIEGALCDDLMRDAGYVQARYPFTDQAYEQLLPASGAREGAPAPGSEMSRGLRWRPC
jgi:hypothetical protein